MFDYQKVKLVALTQPTPEMMLTFTDTSGLISYCARVSNPSNQANLDTAPKLLAYCIKNKHWSIFEMAHAVMEIETTRDIARQILRHRSFSFQEFSQRYAEVDVSSFQHREARLQDKKNRQNSIDTNDVATKHLWEVMQREVIYAAEKSYRWAIDNGIAKEQARAVLPEGMTMSKMYMAGSLRSWIHYCELRMKNGTQKEHIDIAEKCWDILSKEFSFLKEIEATKENAQ
jgi:thymidylate synthase (FAD)